MVSNRQARPLEGRVALVTGAARGMGRAHVVALAEAGATVFATDVCAPEPHGCEDHQVVCMALDVTEAAAWERVRAAVLAAHGRLDILVNNAGVLSMGGAEDIDEAEWARTMDVNARSILLGLRALLPLLRGSSFPSVINVSSVYGLVGATGYIAYTASKGAVTMMTKSAAVTYGSEGIRFNSVHPGVIRTEMLESELAALGADALGTFLAATPLRREGTPEEVSQAVVFLASSASSYITGAELVVDGGLIAGR